MKELDSTLIKYRTRIARLADSQYVDGPELEPAPDEEIPDPEIDTEIDVFYEERYPIWPDERRGKPIYPWKIRFSDVIALSPDNWPRIGLKPLTIPDERFLSGIGLGLLLPNEYVDLIKRAEQRWGLMINL